MPVSIDPPPADDELECGRCGAHFYYELTRCPNCGVNIYEPEDQIDHSDGVRTYQGGIVDCIDGFIRRFTKKPHQVDELCGASIIQAELFDDLLIKVGGDRATLERLIDYKRQ